MITYAGYKINQSWKDGLQVMEENMLVITNMM